MDSKMSESRRDMAVWICAFAIALVCLVILVGRAVSGLVGDPGRRGYYGTAVVVMGFSAGMIARALWRLWRAR